MTRHRLALPIALGAPVVIAVIGVLVVLMWTPDLPDRVATHWGSGDRPDGFTSASSLAWLVGGLSVLIPLPCVGLFLALKLPSRTTSAFGAGLAAFLVAILLTSVAPQRGLEDSSEVSIAGWWFVVSIGAGLLVALLAAVLTPRDRFEGSEPARPVPAGATAVRWSGAVSSDVLLGIAGFAVLVGLVLLITPLHIVGYIVLPIAVLLACTAWWRVTVDERGVVVRCALPWPRLRIRPDQLTGAEVEHISALGDFGGWGIRLSGRGTGIVLSSGEAVIIHRRDARPLVIVIDDAPAAAAAINSRLTASD